MTTSTAHDGARSTISVRLDKYALALPGPMHFDPLLLVVAQTMERQAEAQAVRHFVLTEEAADGAEDDEEDHVREHALLWLFQPNIRLALDRTTASRSGLTTTMKLGSVGMSENDDGALILQACKVLYRRFEPGTPRGDYSSAEPLVLPPAACERVLSALEASTSVFPPSRRHFGSGPSGVWEVGWLPKADECG